MNYTIEGFPNEKIINFRRNHVEIIKGSTYITDIGCFPNTTLHQVIRKQGIEENIICLCIKGRGYVQIKNEIREVKKNDYFVIPKNYPHKYFSGIIDGWGLYFIHVAGVNADQFCENHKGVQKGLTHTQLHMVYSILDNLINLLDTSTSEENIIYVNTAVEFLQTSLQIYEMNKATISLEDEIIAQFLNYVENNLAKKVSIKILLSELNVSQAFLYKLTHERFNVSPMQYVYEMKLDIAAELLLTTNLKVANIAHRVGFVDQYHFSRKFKALTGMSPIEYRNTNK